MEEFTKEDATEEVTKNDVIEVTKDDVTDFINCPVIDIWETMNKTLDEYDNVEGLPAYLEDITRLDPKDDIWVVKDEKGAERDVLNNWLSFNDRKHLPVVFQPGFYPDTPAIQEGIRDFENVVQELTKQKRVLNLKFQTARKSLRKTLTTTFHKERRAHITLYNKIRECVAKTENPKTKSELLKLIYEYNASE